MRPERMTYLEEHPTDITTGEVRALLAAVRDRDASLVAALDGMAGALHRAQMAERGLAAAADIVAGRAKAEVWDASVAPGGVVCAVPVPADGAGLLHEPTSVWICGMPIEADPCPDHGGKEEK